MRWTNKAAIAAGCAAMLVTAACSSTSSTTAAPASASSAATSAAAVGGSSSAAGSATAPTSGGFAVSSAPSGSSAPAAALAPDPFLDKSDSGKTINVLMVNNPQMLALQKHIGAFTAQTGINVKFTVLPENDMRNKASLEFKNQAGQYDVTTLSNFEVPFYAKNGWLAPLDDYLAKDPGFKQSDIFPALTSSLSQGGKIYGEPFYGESSFLMYRKDVFQAKGLTMPANPTWDEVAALAAKVDGAQAGMKGICLRGEPGWGQLGAPLTTMVNTFGGTWFNKDWSAAVNAQPFKDAANFYVNLVKAHGEVGASTAGFTECLSAMEQSKVAMWYDATSAAGSLEGTASPVAGKMGYVQAPVKVTKSSGWLYAWSWMMEKASKNQDPSFKFISWASSQQYENIVGAADGWATVPAGKRASTYANADYNKAAAAFGPATLEALKNANPTNPGVQPRPTVGIQFVDIPEFTDLGDKVTALLSAAIAGNGTVDDALNQGQTLATAAGANYK
ncbi:sugar ABC transporter substrate-binding protein [Nakamurella sp. PAMC28650]|uniref:ABC transporter substrate-binding protein n=1 Tax=Nakamurella sp. PAMC28650 TaxID=2762325 RepID=UPI001C9A5E3C|nr:sugar ABC transporter substrate-binding protein [Nakamurella sp. PAMC28650]